MTKQTTTTRASVEIPERKVSRFANQYRDYADLQQLLDLLEKAGMEAMTSKNIKLAQSSYELAIEIYHQILSLKPKAELRRTATDAMLTVAERYPGQHCMNEALSLCELSNKVNSLENQLRYLLDAKAILEDGLVKKDISYDNIRSIYEQVVGYVERIGQRMQSD